MDRNDYLELFKPFGSGGGRGLTPPLLARVRQLHFLFLPPQPRGLLSPWFNDLRVPGKNHLP